MSRCPTVRVCAGHLWSLKSLKHSRRDFFLSFGVNHTSQSMFLIFNVFRCRNQTVCICHCEISFQLLQKYILWQSDASSSKAAKQTCIFRNRGTLKWSLQCSKTTSESFRVVISGINFLWRQSTWSLTCQWLVHVLKCNFSAAILKYYVSSC